MKFSIQTLIWGCVLLALLIAGSLAFIPKPVEAELAPISEGPIKLTVQEDGKTRIREKYVISAPVAGRLSRIELNAGDALHDENTLVAVIMPAEPMMLDVRAKAQAQARVEQADASLQRSQAAVEQVRVDYELSENKLGRLQKLVASKSISQDELESAQADFNANKHRLRTNEFDVEIATFELKMAKAALMQFGEGGESNVEPFEVYAPISGVVLRVFQESSTVLSVGTPLIEVGDPGNIEMEVDVLSTDAVRIAQGAELSVEHWGGSSPLKGLVRVVEPGAFTKVSSLGVEEQRVNVIADFDEPPERLVSLGDGYRIEANIVIEQLDNALCIPNAALFRFQRIWHVFVVVDGRAEIRPVEVGLQDDRHTEIRKGVGKSEQVILYPSEDIQNGTRIKPAK